MKMLSCLTVAGTVPIPIAWNSISAEAAASTSGKMLLPAKRFLIQSLFVHPVSFSL
jgi:hypothetical protein